MSLVADLLSKVKPTGRKGDVPPNLKKVVSDLSDKKATKKKIIIYSVLFFLSIAGGIGAVFFLDLYVKPKTNTETSSVSREEIKKRARARQAAQAIEKKQEKDKSETDSSQKIETASKPSSVKQKEKPDNSEQLPKAAKKEPTAVDKQLPKKIEKQKEEKQEPDIKQEEIKKLPEPEERYEVVIKESMPREVEPVNKEVSLYQARSYENKGDYSKAFDSYKTVLDVTPNDYHVINNISSVLLHLGAFEESIEYSEMALGIKKDYVPSLVNLGIAYIKSGNLTAGEGYLLKVLSLNPTHDSALFNLALLYEKIGEYDKAFGLYQRLSKMNDYRGFLGLARIAEKQNRLSDAISFYNEIISTDGVDPRVKKMATDRIYMLR